MVPGDMKCSEYPQKTKTDLPAAEHMGHLETSSCRFFGVYLSLQGHAVLGQSPDTNRLK